MGLYSTLNTTLSCPRCHVARPVRVQFKFGARWALEYQLGDVLEWGFHDVGVAGIPRVVVDGYVEPCSVCGFDEWQVYVFVEKDRLTSVTAVTGEYDFVAGNTTFLVLES